MPTRFHDSGRTLWSFEKSVVLVECPHCGKSAYIKPVDPQRDGIFDPRRVTCAHCGYRRQHPAETPPKVRTKWSKEFVRGGKHAQVSKSYFVSGRQIHVKRNDKETEGFFGLPLYLQTECLGHLLWAVSPEHLTWLEEFISATVRDVSSAGRYSAVRNLPRWMIVAHRRSTVLKGLERLRERLGGSLPH